MLGGFFIASIGVSCKETIYKKRRIRLMLHNGLNNMMLIQKRFHDYVHFLSVIFHQKII